MHWHSGKTALSACMCNVRSDSDLTRGEVSNTARNEINGSGRMHEAWRVTSKRNSMAHRLAPQKVHLASC